MIFKSSKLRSSIPTPIKRGLIGYTYFKNIYFMIMLKLDKLTGPYMYQVNLAFLSFESVEALNEIDLHILQKKLDIRKAMSGRRIDKYWTKLDLKSEFEEHSTQVV